MFKGTVKEQYDLKANPTVQFAIEKAKSGNDLILTNAESYPGVSVLVRELDISDGKVKLLANVTVSVANVFAFARFQVKKNVTRKSPMFIDDIQTYNRGYGDDEGGGFSRTVALTTQFKADLLGTLEQILEVGEVQEVANAQEADLANELGDPKNDGKGKKRDRG